MGARSGASDHITDLLSLESGYLQTSLGARKWGSRVLGMAAEDACDPPISRDSIRQHSGKHLSLPASQQEATMGKQSGGTLK